MFTRRNFIRISGLSAVPALTDLNDFSSQFLSGTPEQSRLRFSGDGLVYSPEQFLAKLQEINKNQPIERDSYGKGGSVDQLTKKFAALTGKEAAILMPSGTLANQLAISVLSGDNTKAFVQETSHVYRDEGDSAQSVFNKRLIPLAPGKAYFTAEELKKSIGDLEEGEVFKSGYGAVSIENPVRRNNGQFVPIEEIKKISTFCKEKGYKLHLDGARIYWASAFSGTSIAEYSSYFDTVYISLYKYLGAAGGAILCGSKNVIDKMEHLTKIHGGTIYMNWANAAMALHHMEGMEERFKRCVTQANQLFSLLNQLPETKITKIENGTNISSLQLSPAINSKKLSGILLEKHNINLPLANANGIVNLMINETLLTRSNEEIVKAFKDGLALAKG